MLECLELFVAVLLSFYIPIIAIDINKEHNILSKILCIIEVVVIMVMFKLPLLNTEVLYEIVESLGVIGLSALIVYLTKFKKLLRTYIQVREGISR